MRKIKHSASLIWQSIYAVMICAASLIFIPGAAIADPDQKPSDGASQQSAKPKADVLTIPILLVRQKRDLLRALSIVNLRPDDEGVGGAKLAISDNNTTGRFLKQKFTLDILEKKNPEELVAETLQRVENGTGMIVADVDADVLLKLSDALKGKPATILNAGAPDNRLRNEDCRANVLHSAPSYAMLADALGQYLAWKRWRRWFLVTGKGERDLLWASALERAAKRFGMKIVEKRTFEYSPGSRRTDGGYEQIQKQIPKFTQGAKRHDVVVVADDQQVFADYFPYRTWEAKPVVGSAGLSPASWHPAVELWGGTQFQNRFIRMNKRNMRPLDYDVWMAVRTVGEAASRTRTADPNKLFNYMRSPEFELAAFKGQKLTYRDWNGQLRQPVILVTPNLHVTVSPQPEFIHQFSELDTMGFDKPESTCKAYKQ